MTLSFIPTLGTMILGLIAGRWLRGGGSQDSVEEIACLPEQWESPPASSLHFTHICPVVKRIWTPSWTLFSGGVCFLFLAAFLLGHRGKTA